MVRALMLYMTGVFSVSLSGCARPADRIFTSLQRYGVDGPQASCIGARLQSTLTVGQLRQLGRAANKLTAAPGRHLQPDDFLRAAAKIDDLKIPVEAARAAGRCGLLAPRA